MGSYMKVGIIFSLATYGGVQSCVISLTKGLNDIGIEPDLITDRPINQNIVSENHLRIHERLVKYSISRKLAQTLSKYLAGALDILYFYKASWLPEKYDFIYIFQPNVIIDADIQYLYYLSMSPRAFGYSGQKWRSRLKFLFYDLVIRHFVPVYNFAERSANCVINSSYTEGFFFSNYGRHLRVVYPPTPIQQITKIEDADKSTVLFLSRITPAKRPELFVGLAAEFPDLEFIMIGGCESPEYFSRLKALKQRMNISNLQLHINIPRNQVIYHLQKAKYYVFTAKNEHFGITTVEAMAYGAIPFVHDSGGQREIVPWDILRYRDQNMVTKFRNVLSLDQCKIPEFREGVRKQSQQFSEENFISKMLEYLPCH